MIKIEIPAFANLVIEHVVFDYNGTLAKDGTISERAKVMIEKLQEVVEIIVLTADTFGTAREQLEDLPVRLQVISKTNGSEDKARFIRELGIDKCMAVGNGNNDAVMLKEAALSVCIVGPEGCATRSLLNSDIAVNSVEDCIELLLNPMRLKATLRG